MDESTYYIENLRKLHKAIRDSLDCERCEISDAKLSHIGAGDYTYTIDDTAEKTVIEFAKNWSKEKSFVLVSEDYGRMVFPEGCSEDACEFILIVDSIDGTRNLMYDLRGAWTVSGIAPNKGSETSLQDVTIALQTEIPTSKMNLIDEIVYNGTKTDLYRIDVCDGERKKIDLKPSKAKDLNDGYVVFSKFFPGVKNIISEIEHSLYEKLEVSFESERIFDDQYISSAGQLYMLATGRYRFVADIRAWLADIYGKDAIAVKPYDIGSLKAFEEMGIIITDIHGNKFDAPLDVTTKVSFIAYANENIRKIIEPHLMHILNNYENK